MRTVQEHRRDRVYNVLDQVLGDSYIHLRPLSISALDNKDLEKTTIVDMSFVEEFSKQKNRLDFKRVEGTGFVDAVFQVCLAHYEEKYTSLTQIVLEDFLVQPIFSFSKSRLQADASTEVILKVGIKNKGVSDFRCTSHSIVYSGFSAILKAIEFYMNCEKAFEVLVKTIADARSRNRSDIEHLSSYRLSFLAEVGTCGPR